MELYRVPSGNMKLLLSQYILISKRCLFFVCGVYVLLISCEFYIPVDEELTMSRIDSANDTITLWPELVFMFSVPLKDSSVSLVFEPDPGPSFYQRLNKTRDTLQIHVTGVLEGNTRYTLTLAREIVGQNGSTLSPEEVQYRVYTRKKEKEPNNSIALATIVETCCYGVVVPKNDTDYYWLENPQAKGFYLKNHRSKSGYVLVNSSGELIGSDTGLEEVKSFLFSDSIAQPLYVGVVALVDNDARYEIGYRY